MKRFLMSASVAALGLALVAVPQTRADGRQGGGSNHSSNGHNQKGPSSSDHRRAPVHFDHKFPNRSRHEFKANRRFEFGKYGHKSLSYTHYRWFKDYGCYLYWAPSYRCWFFYEPTFSCYVPASYYRQVYPEVTPAVAATITPPSVVQQTTVVVSPSAPAAEPIAPPPPPAIAPPPATVQNTKVGAP